MARDALNALRKSIKEGRFDRAYYLYGDEEYRKDEALRALIAGAVEATTRDFNLDQMRGSGLPASTLGSLLAMPPVLAPRRMLVVREVGSLKKDARAVLDHYLKKPAEDVVLVLVSSAGEKVDGNIAAAAINLEFSELDQPQVITWIVEHAREQHGATLTQDAAELLYAAVGGDLAALATEIDKAVSYTGGGAGVDTDVVEAVVGVRHGETLGDLLDAVARRRAAEALALVPRVLAQPKNGVVQVVGALGTQLMAIGVGLAVQNARASDGAVRARFWDLLKASAPNTGGPWGEAVDRWVRALPLWNEADIQSGLRALLATDRAAKDSRIATDEQLVSTVVLELCGGPRRAAA